MIIGAAIETASYSAAQMVVGRIITGLGMDTNGATFPRWAAGDGRARKSRKTPLCS